MKAATAFLLFMLPLGCAMPVGGGVATIYPVVDEGSGLSQPRLGAEDPGYAEPRGRSEADLQPLRSELSLLLAAEKKHHRERGTYTVSLQSLRNLAGYTPRNGIRVDVVQADTEGFAAIATRDLIECAVFQGDAASPRDYARIRGVIACEGA